MADSFPWGMIGGALFFIVAGLYQVVKEFTK
jgi:F0F1-type ATP synthase assembly protein I